MTGSLVSQQRRFGADPGLVQIDYNKVEYVTSWLAVQPLRINPAFDVAPPHTEARGPARRPQADQGVLDTSARPRR